MQIHNPNELQELELGQTYDADMALKRKQINLIIQSSVSVIVNPCISDLLKDGGK